MQDTQVCKIDNWTVNVVFYKEKKTDTDTCRDI